MIRPRPVSGLKWHHIGALCLSLFAFFMGGLVSERVFERMPHLEDELAYLYQARIFAGGQIVIDSPEPPSAYWQPFVVDSSETGKRFGKYTPGWPALLATGVLLGQEWIVNALFAMLVVALVYRLGAEVFNPDVGLIAALLTAFSPAALLLNATLMSHTSGLFLATLFIYSYWRLETVERPHLWGSVAGIALGILAATRPLTTLGIGLPFIAWSGVRLLMQFIQPHPDKSRVQGTIRVLTPLLVLSAWALLFASSIPAFSYAATGDARQNLYELVWDYDRIGFGEGYGRNRHRLEKALNHARFDLSLTASDLFGWQFEPFDAEMTHHVLVESDFYPGTGYSFYLLPLGLLTGLFMVNRRRLPLRIALSAIWAIIAFAWIWLPFNLTTAIGEMGTVASILGLEPSIVGDETFSWFWIIIALLWLYLPLLIVYLFRETPQIPYTWLLFALVASVVIVQMLYWIGSQRYSTRYYFEALTAASLITALPLAWLVRRIARLVRRRWDRPSALDPVRVVAYSACLAFCVFTLYFYSTPRINALYRYNLMSPELIEDVLARRVDERPVLVIVNGTTSGDNRVRWRSYGPLMAVTSPYLDSEIVVVRDFGTSRDELLAKYPNRQVIDLYAAGNEASFDDTAVDQG